MGGNIEIKNEQIKNGEKRGDIIVKSSELKNIKIPSAIIPNIIDEIPILAIAGLFAQGNFEIRNAKELRQKESDRIKSVCENLRLLGVDLIEFEDGFEINGRPNKEKVTFESHDDHRIAMAFSVLSCIIEQGGEVNNFECVSISNPDFLNQLKEICS
jgi:3-phosphoshikimate 1-carboxyvinyltransferase